MGNVSGLLRTIAAFGSLLLMSLGADAARVERVQADNCDILLTGTIEPGDSERLELSGEGGLCLNSPGGDFSEAIKIIDRLSETATVVDKGASCLGVCAYIFMAGRRTVFHEITEPRRRLHVGGKLGFRIALQRRAGETAPDAAERSYREGVQSIAALLRQNASIPHREISSRLPFPRLLLADALASEPDHLLVVDTIGRAARYGIDLIGYDAPTTITEQGLRRACLARLHTVMNPYHAPTDRLNQARLRAARQEGRTDTGLPGRAITLREGQLLRTSMPVPGEKRLLCVADLYLSAKRGLHLQVSFGERLSARDVADGRAFKKSVDAGDTAPSEPAPGDPLWYVLPEQTRLSDLQVR